MASNPRYVHIGIAAGLGAGGGFLLGISTLWRGHLPREWFIVALAWGMLGALGGIVATVLAGFIHWAMKRDSDLQPALKWGGSAVAGILAGGSFFYWFTKNNPLERMAASSGGYLGPDGKSPIFWSDLPFFIPWLVLGACVGLVIRVVWMSLAKVFHQARRSG